MTSTFLFYIRDTWHTCEYARAENVGIKKRHTVVHRVCGVELHFDLFSPCQCLNKFNIGHLVYRRSWTTWVRTKTKRTKTSCATITP